MTKIQRGMLFLWPLRKCIKRMSRNYRGESHKWIKDGFFAVADWSRHQRNTTMVTVEVLLISKGFCLLFFVCLLFHFVIPRANENVARKKAQSNISNADIFMYVQIKSNSIKCFSAPYLPSNFWWLMDTDMNTHVWQIISFQ